jgi:hypothetical protein
MHASVKLRMVRDCVVKLNAQGPAGLIDRKPPGQPARLTAGHRAALVKVIEDVPISAVNFVTRPPPLAAFQKVHSP